MKGTSPLSIGILGATGLVGHELLGVLAERGLPCDRLLASARSAGARIPFAGRDLEVREATPQTFEGLDLVLASAGATVARELLPGAAAQGVVCIDNSSAFRMDPDVPLVVPEVNPQALGEARCIANPNCSTIQLVCALAPLERAFGLSSVRVATYQSLSGAGFASLRQLDEREAPLDVTPSVGEVDGDDVSVEEHKLRRETQKILGRSVDVHATCVRVPTRVGHGEAVWVTTRDPLSLADVRSVLEEAPGLTLDPSGQFTTPADVTGRDDVHVSRLRVVGRHELAMWVVADNLRKGAATNAVQIAELVLARDA